jgi:hypothetical protein
MTHVNILTEGFISQNSKAFLLPLILHEGKLQDFGITYKIFTAVEPKLLECDLLIVDSKYFRQSWDRGIERTMTEFAWFSEKVDALAYFDTADSTGWLQPEVLPFVNRYFKSQLLKDRALYQEAHYGYRLYTQYMHDQFGVEDSSVEFSTPVENHDELAKLSLSWNSGLGSYGLWGVRGAAIFERFPVARRLLLNIPAATTPPSSTRKTQVSCRMSVGHYRETVARQRLLVRDTMTDHLSVDRVSRRNYIAELADSKVVLSPFGFGEINIKDFETFISGALLMKPDMSHVETWPDYYRDGETYVAFRWDTSDLREVLDEVLAGYQDFIAIAHAGQEIYCHHAPTTATGAEAFVTRFGELVELGLSPLDEASLSSRSKTAAI